MNKRCGAHKVLSLVGIAISFAISACNPSEERAQNAQVLYRAINTPCGGTLIETGSRESVDYTFTGYEPDFQLAMLDANARFYDPDLCQFSGVDPVDKPGNAYKYAANNPLRFVDPDGRDDRRAVPENIKAQIGFRAKLLVKMEKRYALLLSMANQRRTLWSINTPLSDEQHHFIRNFPLLEYRNLSGVGTLGFYRDPKISEGYFGVGVNIGMSGSSSTIVFGQFPLGGQLREVKKVEPGLSDPLALESHGAQVVGPVGSFFEFTASIQGPGGALKELTATWQGRHVTMSPNSVGLYEQDSFDDPFRATWSGGVYAGLMARNLFDERREFSAIAGAGGSLKWGIGPFAGSLDVYPLGIEGSLTDKKLNFFPQFRFRASFRP